MCPEQCTVLLGREEALVLHMCGRSRTIAHRRVNESAVVRPHLCVLNTVPVTQGVLAQLSLVWDVRNTYPFDDWSAIA